MSAVGQWLDSVALGQYAALFEDNRIELDILPDLTDDDLEKLGIPLGDRKRLLKAIAALASAPAAPAPSSPAPTVERREVTILFVDLSGYTRLTSTLGAEATHKLVQRFYERIAGIVQRFGGTVERHIGDAVMAVFGVPVAHGNDPERALRAALAIHEIMPLLSDEIGHPLSVHAGIASGQVVASHAGSEFSTVGNAVNLGARLVALAQPGETVLSSPVHRAVAALCTPVDLFSAQRHIDAPRAWLYRRHVLNGLKSIYAAVAARGRPVPTPLATVLAVRTIHEWDRVAIAPRYGYDSPEHYYEALSIVPHLMDLAVPALLVAGRADPIIPATTIEPFVPAEGRDGRLVVRWVDRGGHVNFPRSLDLGFGPERGLEAQVFQWFERVARE